MNKKGFVLLESIVVLVVVALSLSILMSSFSLISRKTKEKEFYDRSSDKYLLYAIMNLGTNETCNYWDLNATCGGLLPSQTTLNFSANPNNCGSTKIGKIIPHCGELFEEFGVTNLYVVEDLRAILNDNNKATTFNNNGVIEYMKTLKKCSDCYDSSNKRAVVESCNYPIPYMIGEFSRAGKIYYASITFTDIPANACCAGDSYCVKSNNYYDSCDAIYRGDRTSCN